MSFWKRVGKQAGKFQFVITFRELTLECEKGPWKPKKLAISIYHRNHRYSSQPHDWEPTINNSFRGKVVWTSLESVTFVITLFKNVGEKEFRDKKRTIFLEEVEHSGRRRPLASIPIRLNLYAKFGPFQSNVIENLKPNNNKVLEVSLSVTYTSTLLREGKATDEDMQSLSSLVSSEQQSLNDVGNLADFEDQCSMGTLGRKSIRQKISELASNYKVFRSSAGKAEDKLTQFESQNVNLSVANEKTRNFSRPPESLPLQSSSTLPSELSDIEVFIKPNNSISETEERHPSVEDRFHQKSKTDVLDKTNDYQERARKILESAKISNPISPSPIANQIVAPPRLPLLSVMPSPGEDIRPIESKSVEKMSGQNRGDNEFSSIANDILIGETQLNEDKKAESNIRSIQDIQEEIAQLENEQRSIDIRAAEVSVRLRESMEPDCEENEEDILLEWLALVNKRNAIVRRCEQLKLLEKQSDLESRHSKILIELESVRGCSDWQKTDANRTREQTLMEDLIAIVKRRNELVEELDVQENAIEEDNDVAQNAIQQISNLRNDQKLTHLISVWSKKWSLF